MAMYGVRFRNTHSRDVGLLAKTGKRPAAPPVRTVEETILYRDGNLDYSEQGGRLFYDDKLVEVEFTAIAKELSDTDRLIAAAVKWLSGGCSSTTTCAIRLTPQRKAHPDSYWSWDSDLCQRNVSEFEGVWYYDGDLSAEMYVVIDGNGDWSYYQRTPGAEAAEMDHGIFTYSTDETSTYYADSTVYDGVSYKVFDFDSDMLIWGDEGAYYRME